MNAVKGRIIVLEGIDASGKSTQFSMLCDYLNKIGKEYKSAVFPRYNEPSATLLKMYLNGDFGSRPDDVSPYASSIFYAADRFASYKQDWGEFYNNGGVVICDRYTTSNAIYQSAKLNTDEERKRFCDWLFDLEYNLMGLPCPTDVLFFDMPAECSIKLLSSRQGKNRDIHEKDEAYLKRCREAALFLSDTYNWRRVKCTENGEILSRERVLEEIIHMLGDIINN